MSLLDDAYKFTIENGIVTAVFEFEYGAWKPESIDIGEAYAVDPLNSSVVIKTELVGGVTKTERYIRQDGGEIFYEEDSEGDSEDGDSASGGQDDLYRFQFDASNHVIAVSKLDDGVWKWLRLDANESFAVDATLGRLRVMKTELDGGQTEIEIYEDLDGNGDYVELGSSQNLDDDVYIGNFGVDFVRAGLGDDDLYGNGGDDDLYGEVGDDDLFGDDGNDDLFGGAGADELYGATGNDRLNGQSGNDYLRAHGGRDDLNGGEGDDSLQGGNGADSLTGGFGRDSLVGGLAADSFVFASRLDSAVGARRDVIVDFNASQLDKINLLAIDANERLSGNQAFAWLGTQAFSGVAGQLRYFTASSPSGIVLQGDVNGDRLADFELSILSVSNITASQLML